MEQELLDILSNLQNGNIGIYDARTEILNLFKASRNSILNGGDELSEYGRRHQDDAERIKDILISKGFINAGLNDAIHLWGEYSDSYCAGWLGLPDDDDDVYDCIKSYITSTNYID